jgi:hypothetical protein
MGVMLALDRPGTARGRRQGQRVRSDEQASAVGAAALPSCDPSRAGRSLSRLTRPALAGPLRLAAAALAAAGSALRRPRDAPDLAAGRR